MKVIGIMSGTSLDGVDYILAEVKRSKSHPKIIYKDMESVRFPKRMREDLFAVCENKMDFRTSIELHYDLGKFYEKSLGKILAKKKWKFDLIGLHGQTVFHNPPKATLQLGEPSFLKSFDVPVVAHFRNKNVAFGGEGAPLAPYFHHCVFTQKNKNVVFINLGGMSNMTYMPKQGKGYATDLGPANVFVDQCMEKLFNKKFDKAGAMALKGLADVPLVLSYVKNHPFYRKKSPKSCGREEFSEKEFQMLFQKMKHLSDVDKVATFSEMTIQFILAELKKLEIDRIVLGGGGALNKYFINRLQYEFFEAEVLKSDDFNWPTQAVEGGAFALLAAMRFWNQSYPEQYLFDQKSSVPLGSIY